MPPIPPSGTPPSHPADSSVWSIGQIQAHGSPGGGRVHQVSPACQSPGPGTVLGRQRAPVTQGGPALAATDPAISLCGLCLSGARASQTALAWGLQRARGLRRMTGTHQHGWDHQHGDLACDGPGACGRTVERCRAAGTVTPAPHHALGTGRGPRATTGAGTDTTARQFPWVTFRKLLNLSGAG